MKKRTNHHYLNLHKYIVLILSKNKNINESQTMLCLIVFVENSLNYSIFPDLYKLEATSHPFRHANLLSCTMIIVQGYLNNIFTNISFLCLCPSRIQASVSVTLICSWVLQERKERNKSWLAVSYVLIRKPMQKYGVVCYQLLIEIIYQLQ